MVFKICRNISMRIMIVFCSTFLASKATLIAQTQQDLDDIQQIVALVNDDVISLYDLNQRALLLALFTGQNQISPEQMQVLQRQAMNALIDDRLKVQESEEFEVRMSTAELEDSFANYANQLGLSAEALEEQLSLAGIQKQSLIQQINGSLSWQGIVQGLLKPQVNITDDEVYNAIESLESNKGKFQYQVSEIFILVTDNARRQESLATANTIYEQLQSGVPFTALAQQFSQSSTAAVGGDMGLVMEENLPVEVREKIVTMEKGEISQPVETEDGIYILQVTDKSQILTITEDDTIINVKFFLFESTEEELAQNNTFQKLSTHFGSEKICQSPIEIGAELGAVEANELSINRIGSLPDQIKNSLLPLEIGYGTNFIEDPDGMVSYVLCEKRIPEVNVPDFDAMLANMTNSRLQLFATRHLRDLRRDAIIDFR